MREVQPIGRLDEDTTGLLLFTDDGALIHKLTSPKWHVPKLYRIDCAEPVTPAQIDQLLGGVVLHDDPLPVRAAACETTRRARPAADADRRQVPPGQAHGGRRRQPCGGAAAHGLRRAAACRPTWHPVSGAGSSARPLRRGSEQSVMPSPDELPARALRQLWQAAGGNEDALQRVRLIGTDPVLPSSFAVGAAAQASLAAGALAAAELGRLRNGLKQQLTVDMRHAALEACTHFLIDGRRCSCGTSCRGCTPAAATTAPAAGCASMPTSPTTATARCACSACPKAAHAEQADVRHALQRWNALDFEQAAADAGLVVAALRSFDEWDRHPQGQAVALQPLLQWTRLGDAPPRALPPLPLSARPLQGVRVLDLTRILAGPVGTRALAAHGADVLLVNSPNLPNIEAIAETSRGKLSAHADLREPAGREAFEQVLRDAHVFVQGYRPGGLQQLGYGAEALAERHPGIVVVSLSAYGSSGPWSGRRGFDSLVQTASGFNVAEAQAFGSGAARALPMQILDHATGHLMALAACAALQRQQREGGSWQVQVSLARTGQWLRGLGRVPDGIAVGKPDFAPLSRNDRQRLRPTERAAPCGAAVGHAGRLGRGRRCRRARTRWPGRGRERARRQRSCGEAHVAQRREGGASRRAVAIIEACRFSEGCAIPASHRPVR